ncbi:MAG: hypothetical protein ACKVK8_02380, partial [Rhodospirillales bacterium]
MSVVVCFGAALVRLAFALATAEPPAGDALVYIRVAENILLNFCVSVSEPSTGACVPHWGGNHLPLYPALIAGTWALTGKSIVAALILQSVLSALAAGRLMYVTATSYRLSPAALALCSAVLVVAPFSAAYSRMLSPEAIAAAATAWFLAELIRSFALGRLQILPVAIPLALAIWARYDDVLLVIPLGIALYSLRRSPGIVGRAALVMLLITLPLVVWGARSIGAGLNFPPGQFYDRAEIYGGTSGGFDMRGYPSWGKTWHLTPFDEEGSDHPVIAGWGYRNIILPERAFYGANDRAEIERLLSELRPLTGVPMPPHIDQRFGELAQERYRANWPYFVVWKPLQRAVWLWVRPYESFAWPSFGNVSMKAELARHREENSWAGVLTFAVDWPFSLASKVIPIGWRYLAALFLIAHLFGFWRRQESGLRVLLAMAVSYALARTVFLGAYGLTETRFLMECGPFIDIAIVLAGVNVLSR